MDFRRIPFSFSTTDPLKRQEELQRRFGLPANKSNMYVDFANPGAMGIRPDISSASNSPRLQHRVPIFVEGQSEPTKPSVDAQNVDTGRKPHVRIIPIEIEGEDNAYKKHCSLSGLAESVKERVGGKSIPAQTFKHPVQEPVPQSPKGPRVCNIPIKIEGSDHVVRPTSPVKTHKVKNPESPKQKGVKLNGCSASKVPKVNEQKDSSKSNEKKESPELVILKKIQIVEEKLEGYHAEVENFSGTNKEKQYRYLDEMLTRCMLELDEIDTMGLDTIRLARKAAVKKVQASVDLLELKVTRESQVIKEPMEVESTAYQTLENTEGKDKKVADTEVTKNCNTTNLEAENTNVEMSDALSERINEKVESISIMETEDKTKESNEKELAFNVDNFSNETGVTDEKMSIELVEPAQIAEVEAEAGDIITLEVEPIIEEPSSESKEENAVYMDLDSYNCDPMLDETSIQICEVENSRLDPNDLRMGAIGQLDRNLETELAEGSDIPVETERTVLSDAKETDDSLALTAKELSVNSMNSKTDSAIVTNDNVPSNL